MTKEGKGLVQVTCSDGAIMIEFKFFHAFLKDQKKQVLYMPNSFSYTVPMKCEQLRIEIEKLILRDKLNKKVDEILWKSNLIKKV